MADNFLVFNAAEAIQYADVVKGTYYFEAVIPTAPTASDVRIWGLYSKNRDLGLYFEITGTTFRAVVKDGNKDKIVTSEMTFETSWVGVPIEYKIIWDAGSAEFYVDRVHKCTLSFADDDIALATEPLSLYIRNGNSDNMLVGTMVAKNVFQYL